MKIESSGTDIEKLLGSNFFYIPRFQRPYSWDDDNIMEFWEDLIENEDNDYFIGSMVIYKKKKQEFGLVDGQQRLTTITILLCVLRDTFKELKCKDDALGIHQLIERKDRGNKDTFVLKTETSFPYFQARIQEYDTNSTLHVNALQEEKNLKNTHKIFKKSVDSIVTLVNDDSSIDKRDKLNTKIKRLKNIRDTILNLHLILVTLENEDDAYLIFETLNTRGKDLSLTDLAKNHFSKHMKAKGDVDHHKLQWKKMLETIHNSAVEISPDSFLHHFWASRYGGTTLKKVFPKLKKEITKSNAKPYLDSLVSDSKLYRSILDPNYAWSKNETEVSKSLLMLQIFKLLQATPAVLSLVRAYRNKIIKYAKLRDSIATIEKFHFIFTAITSSRSSGGISSIYTSFAKQLFDAKNSEEASVAISILIKKLKEKVPSREEFIVAFKEVSYTEVNSKQKNLVRYILRTVAEYKKVKHSVDYDDLTIEHIHPQSLNDNWSGEIIGSLGNLLLVDSVMNQLLGSKEFKEKKKILIAQKYDLPQYILKTEKWTQEVVTKNTETMASLAYDEIWKIK